MSKNLHDQTNQHVKLQLCPSQTQNVIKAFTECSYGYPRFPQLHVNRRAESLATKPLPVTTTLGTRLS